MFPTSTVCPGCSTQASTNRRGSGQVGLGHERDFGCVEGHVEEPHVVDPTASRVVVRVAPQQGDALLASRALRQEPPRMDPGSSVGEHPVHVEAQAVVARRTTVPGEGEVVPLLGVSGRMKRGGQSSPVRFQSRRRVCDVN